MGGRGGWLRRWGVSAGDLGAGMQFNLFNSTPSIPFGDAVVQLHGPNAE
jgi:hypothetical protein